MKRVLSIVLAAALVVALAVPALATEVTTSGKEVGISWSTTDGKAVPPSNNLTSMSTYLKIGTLQFVDGSTTAKFSNLKLWLDGDDVNLTLDKANDGKQFFIQTGDALKFTFSDDNSRWLPYLGYLKPTANITNKNARALLTIGGNVAGFDVALNSYRSETGRTEVSAAAKATFGSAAVAGFVGRSNDMDFRGADISVSGVAGATVSGGIYQNSNTGGNGTAYMTGISGLKAGNVTVDVTYSKADDKVVNDVGDDWRDGNIPAANTNQVYTKGVTNASLFNINNKVTTEFTRKLATSTNNIKVTDEFSFSELLKDVKLTYNFGSDVKYATFTAEGALVTPIAGLTIYPKVIKAAGHDAGGYDLKSLNAAEYKFSTGKILGGLHYMSGDTSGIDLYYGYAENSQSFGSLNTKIAGIYLKRDMLTTPAEYRRVYGNISTDLSDAITGVGVKALYKSDKGVADTILAFTGTYNISSDTKLNGYFYPENDMRASRVYTELVKTAGNTTFKLSYGDKWANKDVDDKPAGVDIYNMPEDYKEWVTAGNVMWGELVGDNGGDQKKVAVSVTIKF